MQSNADAMLRTVMQRLDVRGSVNAVNAERETALLMAARQGLAKMSQSTQIVRVDSGVNLLQSSILLQGDTSGCGEPSH